MTAKIDINDQEQSAKALVPSELTETSANKPLASPFMEGIFKQRANELSLLLSQSERAFIIGAGCSKCANLPLTRDLTDLVLQKLDAEDSCHKILLAIKELYGTDNKCTIEDYLSELVDLLAISERRVDKAASIQDVELHKTYYTAAQVRACIEAIKHAIAVVIQEPKCDLSHHREFVKTIHQTLRSGKGKSAVDYFVLNYDTLIEDSLALERIAYVDGMEGGANAWWNFSLYESSMQDARVFKIHGSIDWRQINNDLFPRRLRLDESLKDASNPILIWPATTKYKETQLDPFAQIFQEFCRAIRPTTDAGIILTIIGYSFNDAHINYELERALRDSANRINLITFTSDDEPSSVLKKWLSDSSIGNLIRVHANKGFFHGETVERSQSDLLWWKFEELVDLLGGKR